MIAFVLVSLEQVFSVLRHAIALAETVLRLAPATGRSPVTEMKRLRRAAEAKLEVDAAARKARQEKFGTRPRRRSSTRKRRG